MKFSELIGIHIMFIIEDIINRIESINPEHAFKLKKNLSGLEERLLPDSEFLFSRYKKYLTKESKSLDFAVECYLRMCNDMLEERRKFVETGKYSNVSFEEVEKNIYSIPEVMTYHMHGLVLGQFLWFDQYYRIKFFSDNILKYTQNTKRYLEIGGGHGLYMLKALEMLPADCSFDLVDISQSSIDLARGIIDDKRVNYFLKNIFDFKEDKAYDFFTMGEVLEHVEEPTKLLKKLANIIGSHGRGYISTPINSPMIDHIYLFNNAREIRDIFDQSGMRVLEEKIVISEHLSTKLADKFKVPVMYAAFVESK